MALADFLQALLRQPGGPQAALADAASAQGSAGPNGSAAYQNALQAAFRQQATPQNPYMAGNPSGLLSAGNIDLYHRPIVHNPDGSISTVRSMSFGEDGKEILVPTVSPDGKILTDQQAIDQYHKTGQNLGIFDNPKDATVYANSLHNQQANLYVKPQASSGGIGDFLQGLINPQARGRNQTVHWLQNQGMDAGTATLLAGDKTLLRNYLGSRIQGNSPEEALKLQKLQLEVGNLKNPTTNDIREYQFSKSQGYRGSFQDWMLENKRAGATNISDIGNTKGETTYDQNLGKSLAEKTVSIMDAGMNAPNKIGTYQMLKDALANVYQGAGGDAFQNLRRIGSSLGFDIEHVGDGDLAQSISKQLALQMRNPAGGAGMPGAMSDADRAFLEATVPGLNRTPQGNAQLIDYMTRVEQRNMDVAKMAQAYMDQNGGRLDYKFFNRLADWSKANPLFPDRPMTSSQSKAERGGNGMGAPSVGTVEDGWVFQGGDPGDPKSWKKQ